MSSLFCQPNPKAKRLGGRPIQLGELFCGAGGSALGASLATFGGRGYHHSWSTDIDADACATFQNNIDCDDVINSDISQVDFKSLPTVDGLVFGFPCNDFSQAGKQVGTLGESGSLYKQCIRALVETNPLFFVAENVEGIRKSNSGDDYRRILCELSDCGYTVSPHLYEFEYYGVPQRRHRVVFVGFRKELGVYFDHPYPETNLISVSEALADIPATAANHEMPTHSKMVAERLSHIPPGENAFSANLPEHLRLRTRGVKLSIIYKRLSPDKPSYTITASGGGGTHVYHWSENRALTNRERARIQTFPDDFVFSGSFSSVRKQIGMAVPPAGARAIFQRLLQVIDKNDIM